MTNVNVMRIFDEASEVTSEMWLASVDITPDEVFPEYHPDDHTGHDPYNYYGPLVPVYRPLAGDCWR